MITHSVLSPVVSAGQAMTLKNDTSCCEYTDTRIADCQFLTSKHGLTVEWADGVKEPYRPISQNCGLQLLRDGYQVSVLPDPLLPESHSKKIFACLQESAVFHRTGGEQRTQPVLNIISHVSLALCFGIRRLLCGIG